jgi:uncharacterized ferritin-like protein (DUF455 family)
MVSLTFEQANLDFAPHYGRSFKQGGDNKSAALMDQILRDEIRHVSFGVNWLQKLMPKKEREMWDHWQQCQKPYLNPKRAKGFLFSAENRRKANIPEDWIAKMQVL